jgi:(2Fe-2S) ferredoxin
MGQYKYHVFVCTYGKTCPKQGAEDVHDTLKKAVKESGLKDQVRINHAGCMNQCGHGPMVVIYPENVWYSHVDQRGARRIFNEHILRGNVVDDYVYVAPPGDNKI